MIRALLVAATLAAFTSAASAQVLLPNPYYRPVYIPPQINPFVPWNNGVVIQPWPRPATVTVIGTLPNGITVINPWGPRINPYFASNFNPYLGYGYSAGYWNGYYANPYLDAYYGQNPGLWQSHLVQVKDPRGFLVGPPSTPTVAVQDGSRTTDGLAPRLPATGSLTGLGAYDPFTGTYLRPAMSATVTPEPSQAK